MGLAPASSYLPPPVPTAGARGIPPLPLLTLLNYFNYMDRQVVYGMSDKISETFHLSQFQFGWLAFVNLIVFAFASLISGPIADRIGPRKVIFAGVVVWSLATIGSALSHSFWTLLFFRAVVGVGEVGVPAPPSPPLQPAPRRATSAAAEHNTRIMRDRRSKPCAEARRCSRVQPCAATAARPSPRLQDRMCGRVAIYSCGRCIGRRPSRQISSIRSVSTTISCRRFTVHGLVYAFASSTVKAISRVP